MSSVKMLQNSHNIQKDNEIFMQQEDNHQKNITFSNQLSNIEEQKLPIKPKKHLELVQGSRRFKWTVFQQRKYLKFIELNKQTLEQDRKADKQKIYNQMAKFINTDRKPVNCKSHHQKILHKFKSIDRTLKELPQMLKKQEMEEVNHQRLKNVIKQKLHKVYNYQLQVQKQREQTYNKQLNLSTKPTLADSCLISTCQNVSN